jgi:hypothetical protein
MIIAGDKFGQLANRLFKFGHLIACSMENNTKLVYPHFDDYKHLFPSIQKEHGFSIYFHENRLIHKILLTSFTIFNLITKYFLRSSQWHENFVGTNVEINLSDPAVKAKLKKKIVVLNGWNIRDRASFNARTSEIKEIFKPSGVHKDNINLFISSLRGEYDYLIGVHIRLGDYKNWAGGKYYYPLEFYANKCKEMLGELKQTNRNTVFVICSDEDIDIALFRGINFQKSTGHIIEDLYVLSNCDYIFGPPSTYSMWASFYGGKPLLHLHDKAQNLKINDFNIHSE